MIMRSDPLLSAANVLIVLIQVVVIFAMVMIGIGIGALFTVEQAEVAAKIAEAGAPPHALWLIIGAMALIMGLLALGWRFFQELSGIVKSVGAGDPFVGENGSRLTRMGWLSLAAHGLTLVIVTIVAWFAPYLEKAGHDSQLGFGIEPTGLLLTLILFILARVFRRGTEMRDELEGTV